MAIKQGPPTIYDLSEGNIEYRYVRGRGVVLFANHGGELYSLRLQKSALPKSIDKISSRTLAQGETTLVSSTVTSTTNITGNYVATVTGGAGIDSTGATTGEDIDHSLTLNISEFSDVQIASGDKVLVLDSDNSTEQLQSIDGIATLFAGAGLTASSAVMAVGAGTAIDVNANDIAVDVSDFLSNGANNYVVTAITADTMNAEANLQFSGSTLTVTGNITVPDDGDIGSVSATDAIQISSAGIVTLKDDLLIKDGGTIGVASVADAMTISAAGIVSFKDDITIKDGGTIGTSTDADAITIAAAGAVTFSQRDVHSLGITIADAGNIGSASDLDAIAIASGGDVTFSQDVILGTNSGSEAGDDAAYSNGIIGSSDFVSGFTGGGWKLNHSSNDFTIELDNMFLRGTLSVYELLIQQIRATNGAVFVTSAAKVEAVSGLAADDDDGYITFEDPSGNAICPFAVGDIIMMQRLVPGALVAADAAGGATNVIRKLVYKVTHIGEGANANNVATVANINYNNTTFPVAGDDFVRIGSISDTDRKGLIYLTSDDTNAPFMDVKDGVSSYALWHSTSTTKVRVGKLSGITDSGLNAGSALSGYGLYGGNVFLKGAINATSGHIGADAAGDNGWIIEESKIYNDVEDSYLNLDGSDDYLALGATDASSDIAITSSAILSVAFWIYFPTANAIENIITSHDNDGNYAGWFIQKDASNRISFHWGKGSGGTGGDDRQSRRGNTILSPKTWYFIVISTDFGDDTVADNYIYINGTTSDTITMDGTGDMTTPGYAPSGGSVGKIGGEIFDTDSFGEFKMKNIAVWNVALDTNDLTTLYNSGNYVSWASNSGTYDKSTNLKLHIDFTTGSENDLTTNIGDSDTVLTGGAAIVNTNTSFIGLVQKNASSIANNEAGSSFYAGATANTGSDAAISFGTDGKIRGNGIYVKNNIEYLITASRIFGNGSDGPLTLTADDMSEDENDFGVDLGDNWITSGVLTRDIYCTNLTINANVNIKTGGFRIFVRDTLHIAGSGTSLYNSGSIGDAGSHASFGTGGGAGSGSGAGGAQGSLLGGVAGGAGGAGGNGQTSLSSAVVGSASASITAKTNCVRVYTTNDGARGGDGADGAGSGANSATRSGTASSEGNISITNADLTYIIAMRDFFTIDGTSVSLFPASHALGGGGGGGGGIAEDDQYGGGGGGGGQAGGSGGHVMVVARQITGTLANLSLQAHGGNGGQAGRGVAGASVTGGDDGGIGGAGAGGNGGDGGCIVLITGTDPGVSGSGGIIRTVTGGAAGASNSGGSGNIGTVEAGEPGTVITCHV